MQVKWPACLPGNYINHYIKKKVMMNDINKIPEVEPRIKNYARKILRF